MKPYLFTERNGIYIIDLEKTLEKLKEAAAYAKKTASGGGLILFVGTKKQGQKILEKYAKDCGMPYVTERWVGGFFTNFANVSKLIKKYKSLKEQKESGALQKYTKKEQSDFGKEIEKLQKTVGGLVEVSKLPEAIFVLDAKKEKTAIAEARKRKITIIGFCDANTNPELLDYPIPANDDAVKSIDIITKTLAEAIKEGKNELKIKN
jgi:small subunit ribosomal protein S2